MCYSHLYSATDVIRRERREDAKPVERERPAEKAETPSEEPAREPAQPIPAETKTLEPA